MTIHDILEALWKAGLRAEYAALRRKVDALPPSVKRSFSA